MPHYLQEILGSMDELDDEGRAERHDGSAAGA